MYRLLRAVLAQLVSRGTLHVTMPDGRRFTCGDGNGTAIAIRFADRKAVWGFWPIRR